jgi:acyl-CoA synthetase (AMP-forming)/AMP-acid ligase II
VQGGLFPLIPANLITLLHAHAVAHPYAPALLDGASHPPDLLTFSQFQRAIAQGAAYLRQTGLQPGDHLLVYQPLSVDLFVALGAIFQAGLTATFIDPGMDRTQLGRAADTLAPRAMLGPRRAHLLRLIVPALRRIPLAFNTSQWSLPGMRQWSHHRTLAPLPEIVPCTPEDPALVTATSGSTGTPKYAIRSHGFLQRQHAAIAATLGITAGTVIATTLPIFALSFLASGATVLLPRVDLRKPGDYDAATLLEQLTQTHVTALAASPAFFDRLARTGAARGHTLPEVTQIITGGAPVYLDLLDQLALLAPHATITAVYGATEAEPIALLDHRSIRRDQVAAMRAGMGLPAGKPVENIEVRIIADRWGNALGPFTQAEWDAQPLEPTQAGEIVVTGPHVLTAAELGATTPNKIEVAGTIWHRTGDAGYFDQQGRLWLLGRCAARLAPKPDDARPVVYPLMVEAAVHAFPEVKQAAAVDHAGRRLLLLELYAPQDEAWRRNVVQSLRWANLDAVQVLPRLPVDKRHNAKIDYPALRKLLAQR